MKKSTKPHDRLFKTVFSKRKEARNLLRSFGPKVLIDGLDLRTLRKETDSFVEADLEEYFSDLVYSCRWKGDEIRICLLFEHKSQVVKYPHFQLLRYMLNCWENDISQEQALRPVIPIIVYHGKEKWHYKKLSDYFELPHNDLLPYFPNFEYNLIDTSKYSDKQILESGKGQHVNTLYLLKHKRQKDFLLAHLDQVFLNLTDYLKTEEGKSFFRTILHYMLKTNKFEKSEKKFIMKKIDENIKIEYDNTYDELIGEGFVKGEKEGFVKGKEIGKEEGIEIGKEEGIKLEKETFLEKMIQQFTDWTDKEIADFVEVPIKTVKKLRKQLEH